MDLHLSIFSDDSWQSDISLGILILCHKCELDAKQIVRNRAGWITWGVTVKLMKESDTPSDRVCVYVLCKVINKRNNKKQLNLSIFCHVLVFYSLKTALHVHVP